MDTEEGVDLPLVDFPTDHPAMPEVQALIGGARPIQIFRTGVAETRQCYANVQACAARDGGEMIMGWMLHWLPGVFVQAMHHAVWRMKSGGFVDVTAPQQESTPQQGMTTFIPEDYKASWYRDPSLADRHHILVDDEDVRAALSAYVDNHKSLRELQAIARNDRMLLGALQSPLLGANPQTVPQRQQDLLSIRRSSFRKMCETRQRIFDRYCKSVT